MEKLKGNIQIDEETIGTVKQVCDLETKGEAIMDRETFSCMNPERKCEECEYYHETWNRMALINGLRWILEDDKFGFGTNWKRGSRPQTEEENAGYIICRVIEYLYNHLAMDIGKKMNPKPISQ